jgi:hypothetical protein
VSQHDPAHAAPKKEAVHPPRESPTSLFHQNLKQERAGINEIFDRASVSTAHAHQARMSIMEFCRLTKNGAHEQSILVTYYNH